MSNATIIHGKKGQFQRDDSALRDATIETLGVLKRVAMMWELFPEMDTEERRNVGDAIYRDISNLIDQLGDVDARKGQ